ncbi:MAG: hypothetical protein QNJ46_19370 [Leptolyngbyaceae cyanobacterium MO_188.B28]|nr:hypothetical protein [Leptolyngbyaceae cyanobacterium MO_188.B28]
MTPYLWRHTDKDVIRLLRKLAGFRAQQTYGKRPQTFPLAEIALKYTSLYFCD